jgi:hypothetical protein
MTTNVLVSLAKPKLPLLGAKGAAVFVDGTVKAELEFGSAATIEVSPGEHHIEVELKGVVTRRSKRLTIVVPAGNTATVAAKYGRLWGDIRLSGG